ncbi:MAG TPA: tetratricopeptide repeat protein [Gemmataceae bacterium]|jgi:tetratricopeptide (TPR) repeat protein|nr:tetratricopeptide repeat protein [Gemmataceae bacterium]
MSQTDLQPKAVSRRKRWLLLGVLGIVLLIGSLLTIRHSTRARTAAPPQPDLTGIDPAVRQAIEKEVAHVQTEPQSGSAWGQLGCVFIAHAFEEEAMACFAQAERLDPKNAMWPYFQGLSLLLRDPEQALPKIEQAANLAGDNVVGPRHQLAELYMALNRPEQAGEQFRIILKEHPTNARAHLGLARLALQAGDLDSCRRHLNEMAADPHGRREARALSAEVYQRLGDTKAANRELATMIDLPPDPAWPDDYREKVIKCQVGESVRLRFTYELTDSLGRPAQALQYANQLVSDYPQSPRTWALLGWVLFNQQKYPAAEQALRRSLSVDDRIAEVWLNLGHTRYRQNDLTEAAACFRRAIELKSDHWQAHYSLGLCLKERNQRPAAIAAFREALLCQPLAAPAHSRLGELLLEEHQTGEAVEHLQQAVDLNPNDHASRKLLDAARWQDKR